MKLNLAPVVITGVANGPWIPTDSRLASPTIGVNVTGVVAAGATYSIQTTQDDPYGAAGIVNFNASPTLSPVLAPTANGQYTLVNQFITAVRVVTTVSAGSIFVNAWQSDSTLGG